MKQLFLFFLCLLGLPVLAHHGNFTYDGSTIITVEGEVVEFRWTNPHSVLLIRTDSGKELKIETDGPSLIMPMGTLQDSLVPGEHILAYVSPSNRGRDDDFLGREIIKEDGTLLLVSVAYARRQAREDAPVTDSVLGTWVPDRTNLFDYLGSANGWQLTPAGQASMDAYDPSRPFAQTNCISATVPTLMMYPTANRLVEVNGHIEINADWMGATRTVYMDGRSHPAAETRFYQGHSIGHWEGETLVIYTSNFTENPIGNTFSIASGPNKEVVERITVAADGTTATYQFTLTDPDYMAEPVMQSYQWQYRPDVRVSSEACDLEAASLYLNE